MDNVFHAQSVYMLSCDINSLLCVSCSLSTCIKSIFGRGPGGNRMGGVHLARSISTCWCFLKQGGPKDAKARQRAANLKTKNFWCGQLCSARNRRKIFAETSCALIVSRAIIHHTMLCQLRLHSSSRCFCSCN